MVELIETLAAIAVGGFLVALPLITIAYLTDKH